MANVVGMLWPTLPACSGPRNEHAVDNRHTMAHVVYMLWPTLRTCSGSPYVHAVAHVLRMQWTTLRACIGPRSVCMHWPTLRARVESQARFLPAYSSIPGNFTRLPILAF